MPEDLNPSAVAGQPGTGTEPDATGVTGGGDHPGTSEIQGAQPTGESGSAQGQSLLGPQDLPPELEEARKNLLRDYHEKTQKLAQQRKEMEGELSKGKNYEQDARALSELMQQEWFKKAIESEKKRRSGASSVSAMSDEEWQAVKDDKRAFDEVLSRRIEQIVESRLGNSVQDLKGSVEDMKLDQEFAQVAKKYQDFDDLNDKGLLDPYIERGYGPEDAYIRYQWDQGRGKSNGLSLEKEAERLLASKRASAVEKPGPASLGNASRVIKAKKFDDAFDKVFAALQRGEKDVLVEKES